MLHLHSPCREEPKTRHPTACACLMAYQKFTDADCRVWKVKDQRESLERKKERGCEIMWSAKKGSGGKKSVECIARDARQPTPKPAESLGLFLSLRILQFAENALKFSATKM